MNFGIQIQKFQKIQIFEKICKKLDEILRTLEKIFFQISNVFLVKIQNE
jgi:hypothetical protein